MPPKFERCVRSGGKVRTVKPNKDTYIHICRKDGKSYSGEVKRKKKS